MANPAAARAPVPAAAQDKTAEVRFGVCDWTLGQAGHPDAFKVAKKLGLE
jgi:hypothetical protein